jgi:hypothetical protein
MKLFGVLQQDYNTEREDLRKGRFSNINTIIYHALR